MAIFGSQKKPRSIAKSGLQLISCQEDKFRVMPDNFVDSSFWDVGVIYLPERCNLSLISRHSKVLISPDGFFEIQQPISNPKENRSNTITLIKLTSTFQKDGKEENGDTSFFVTKLYDNKDRPCSLGESRDSLIDKFPKTPNTGEIVTEEISTQDGRYSLIIEPSGYNNPKSAYKFCINPETIRGGIFKIWHNHHNPPIGPGEPVSCFTHHDLHMECVMFVPDISPWGCSVNMFYETAVFSAHDRTRLTKWLPLNTTSHKNTTLSGVLLDALCKTLRENGPRYLKGLIRSLIGGFFVLGGAFLIACCTPRRQIRGHRLSIENGAIIEDLSTRNDSLGVDTSDEGDLVDGLLENKSLQNKDEKVGYEGAKTNFVKNVSCPISGSLMVDPVILRTGQTYERKEIEVWFYSLRNRRLQLEDTNHQKLEEKFPLGVPNIAVKNCAVALRTHNKALLEESFKCTETKTTMSNPFVFFKTGESYDKEAIVHLKEKEEKNDDEIVPNVALKNVIIEWEKIDSLSKQK